MRSALLAQAGVALLVAGGLAAASEDETQALARTRQALRAALVASQSGESTDAQLRAVIDSPQFPSLTQAEQHTALSAAAQIALQLKQPARALPLAVRATALPDQGIDDWSTRLHAAVQLQDAKDEVLCLTTLAERWGSAGVQQASWAVYTVARAAQRAHLGGPRTQMLSLLFELRWTASDGGEPSGLWRELSLALLEQGDRTKAQEVAAHVADPYQLIGMRADRRYAPVLKSSLIDRDVRRVAERQLEARRTAAADAPRSLERIVKVMYSLQNLGRYREVVDTADQVLQSADTGGGYTDLSRQLPWVIEVRASALGDLGQFDEDIAGHRRACELSKSADPSLCINLAGTLLELGHPAEALAALPGSDNLSEYGKAVIQKIRAGAASDSGDAGALETALGYLREHEADGPGQMEHALLISGRTEEAAGLLLARLNDPDQRTDALVALQDYAIPSAAAERAIHAFQALRDRPEIRRAIGATGTIERYPLRAQGF